MPLCPLLQVNGKTDKKQEAAPKGGDDKSSAKSSSTSKSSPGKQSFPLPATRPHMIGWLLIFITCCHSGVTQRLPVLRL